MLFFEEDNVEELDYLAQCPDSSVERTSGIVSLDERFPRDVTDEDEITLLWYESLW